MRNSLNKSPGPWPLVLPARLCGAAAGNQPSGCLVFQVLSQLLTLLEDLDLLVERPEIQVTTLSATGRLSRQCRLKFRSMQLANDSESKVKAHSSFKVKRNLSLMIRTVGHSRGP